MENIAPNDFTKPSAEKIFDLCMEDVFGYVLDVEPEIKIAKKDLNDLLVNYNLQEFSDLLFRYQIILTEIQKGVDKYKMESDIEDKHLLSYKLKVSRILRLFLSSESTEFRNLEFVVRNKNQTINIADVELFEQQKTVFTNEFKRLGLHFTDLSTEEALNIIIADEAWEWFAESGFEVEEITEDPSLVEWFRANHSQPREISLELINKVISDLEFVMKNKKGRFGAKIKNLGIGELAKRLSYLARMNDFLNQDQYYSIKDFPLTNESCRFVYEYLYLWDLLPSKVSFDKSYKEKSANYIKSMINLNWAYFEKRDFRDRRKFFAMFDPDLEKRIELFKKVHDGRISPNEFHKRLSPKHS